MRLRAGMLVLRLPSVTLVTLGTLGTVWRDEVLVVGRRVDVGEQPVDIAEGAKLLDRDHAHPHIVEEAGHLQAPGRQAPRDRLETGARVDGTQWMIPAVGVRHD